MTQTVPNAMNANDTDVTTGITPLDIHAVYLNDVKIDLVTAYNISEGWVEWIGYNDDRTESLIIRGGGNVRVEVSLKTASRRGVEMREARESAEKVEAIASYKTALKNLNASYRAVDEAKGVLEEAKAHASSIRDARIQPHQEVLEAAEAKYTEALREMMDARIRGDETPLHMNAAQNARIARNKAADALEAAWQGKR